MVTFISLFLSLGALALGEDARVHAADNTGGGTVSAGGGVQISSGNAGAGSKTITNPLQSKDILQFLGKIVDIIIIFALPIIVLFIMYGGFLLVTARGDTSKIEDGKKALLWAIVGGVIILGANALVTVISGTVKAL